MKAIINDSTIQAQPIELPCLLIDQRGKEIVLGLELSNYGMRCLVLREMTETKPCSLIRTRDMSNFVRFTGIVTLSNE